MAIKNQNYFDSETGLITQPLEQLPSGTLQTITLGQPETIQLQGDRSQVAAYQQQGEDLILHKQDGDALRYQHFFSVVDGKQSELMFVGRENPPERVQFSEELRPASQSVIALTPVITTSDSAESDQLAGSEAGNGAVAAGLTLEMLGLVDADAVMVSTGEGDMAEASAVANPGSVAEQGTVLPAGDNVPVDGVRAGETPLASAGDTATPVNIPQSDTASPVSPLAASGEFMQAVAAAPRPGIRTPFGNGWVNNEESHNDQYLCGTTGVRGEQQQVIVMINGVSHVASVNSNGNWRQFLSADAMMESLHNGSNAIQVIATNAAGQRGTTSTTFLVDTDAPALRIDTISGDGRIDRAEMNAPVIISGMSEAAVAGQAISMVFNDRTLASIVSDDGSWRFTLEPEELQRLAEGQHGVAITLADAAGNVTTEGAGFYVSPLPDTQPTLAVNVVAGDDKLNMREAVYGLEINGTSTHLAAGTEITLTLDGKTFTGWVWDNAGNWQILLDDTAVEAIADGQYTLNFSATDANGNAASASRDIWMITHPASEPQFSVNEVTQDDVSSNGGVAYVTLSGTVSGDFPITAASLNPGDYPLYDVVFGEDGTWSVTIRQSDLSTTDGYNTMILTVADIAGNSYQGVHQVEVHLDPSLTNSLMLATGESGLDYALLGLNTEQLAEENELTAGSDHQGTAKWAGLGSEPLMTADGNAVQMSTAEGGVWNDSHLRASAGQTDDLYAYGAASHEGTLADLLAQHNLQVQTA